MAEVVKPSVLVTGASGFVGSKLISKIAARCDSVVSMYRRRLPEPVENVFPVCNDLRSAELLGAPLREIDTVIHLAWENDSHDKLIKDRSINLFLARNLIEKMEEAGTPRLIVVSHIGAAQNSNEQFLKDKYEIESLALNSNLNEVIIIRSPIVMSGKPGEDRYLDAMLNLIKFPLFYPVPLSNKRRFELVSVDELTDLIVNKVFLTSDEQRELIQFGNEQKFNLDELMKFVCAKYVKRQKLSVGQFIGRYVSNMIEKFSARGVTTFSEVESQGLINSINWPGVQDNIIYSKHTDLEQILYTD